MIRRRPAQPQTLGQALYEVLARHDTSDHRWREWRELSPEEHAAFETMAEEWCARVETKTDEEDDDT